MIKVQSIGYVVMPGFQVMSLAALSVFEVANIAAEAPLYDVQILSEQGGAQTSSLGMSVDTRPFGSAAFDTVIVGGPSHAPQSTPGLLDFLREAFKASRRVASICTGAFVLGDAGLLDGRRVTTHWLRARELQNRFPTVKIEEDRIFIVDGSVWTSAGMSSGIDLALGMVEQDHGAELTRKVARQLVLYHRRGGGQSQHSALLDMDAKSDRIQTALAYARSNLRAPLSVEQLAGAANLSPRQFSRAFRAETGHSPAKAIEHLRLEAARLMMEQSRHSVEVVATETGFGDSERMRRAFLRAFGQPPQAIRRNALVDPA